MVAGIENETIRPGTDPRHFAGDEQDPDHAGRHPHTGRDIAGRAGGDHVQQRIQARSISAARIGTSPPTCAWRASRPARACRRSCWAASASARVIQILVDACIGPVVIADGVQASGGHAQPRAALPDTYGFASAYCFRAAIRSASGGWLANNRLRPAPNGPDMPNAAISLGISLSP